MSSVNYNNEEVAKMFLAGCVVYDDHCDGEPIEVLALAELEGKSKPLCLITPNARYQSLNGVYIGNDNNLHLSMCSVGGVLVGELSDESIKEYNEGCTFKSGHIRRIYFRDGNVKDIQTIEEAL